MDFEHSIQGQRGNCLGSLGAHCRHRQQPPPPKHPSTKNGRWNRMPSSLAITSMRSCPSYGPRWLKPMGIFGDVFFGRMSSRCFFLFLCVFERGRKRWRVFFVGNVWFIAGSVQVWWMNCTNFNRSPERHRTSWKHELENRKNASGRYWYSYNKHASCFAGNYYGVGK